MKSCGLSSSKTIRIHESRSCKRDQPTVSVDFGGREPSRNYEDETPSTKFARLLLRVWKGNERIYQATNKLLAQDGRKSLEEITEGEEEEVIEEYDSDSDSSLSLSHLSEDDD
ncbi:hypothetical protein ACROYT_G031610 [Oculina patagonica]